MQKLSEFVGEAHGMSLEEFQQAHAHPFLLLEAATADAVPDTGFQTLSSGQPAPELPPKVSGDATSVHSIDADGESAETTIRDQIVPVAKGSGTPFPGMITVGRAGNNDVVLRFQQVSKFHAYFTREPAGHFTLTDAGSTNGTSVNKRPLGEGEKLSLADGDSVNFGGDLPFTFFLPESMHRYLPVLVRRLAEQMRNP